MITDEQAQREMAWAIERAVFEAVEMERARAVAIVHSTNLYSAAIADQIADCIRNCQIQLTQEVICYVSEKVHRRFGSQAPPSYLWEKTSGADASEASTARSERSEPGTSLTANLACIAASARLDARLDRLVEIVEMLIKQDRMRYTLEHLSEKLKAV